LKEEQQFDDLDTKTIWSFEKLQSYFAYVKNQFKPKITKESGEILTKYYQLQRKMSDRIAARTTIRLLESLVRLAQAHARLMFREEVTLQDAIFSVLIIDSSLHMSNLLGVYSVLHSSFPESPDSEYRKHEETVLEKLGLSNVEYEEESQESITEEFDFSHLMEEEKKKEKLREQEDDEFGLDGMDQDSEDEILQTNSKFYHHLEKRNEQKKMNSFLNSDKPSQQAKPSQRIQPSQQTQSTTVQKSTTQKSGSTEEQMYSTTQKSLYSMQKKVTMQTPESSRTSGKTTQPDEVSPPLKQVAKKTSTMMSSPDDHLSQTSETSSNLMENESPTNNSEKKSEISFQSERFLINYDNDSLGISDISNGTSSPNLYDKELTNGSQILYDDEDEIQKSKLLMDDDDDEQINVESNGSQLLMDDNEELMEPSNKNKLLMDDDDEEPPKIETKSQLLIDDDNEEFKSKSSQILMDDDDESPVKPPVKKKQILLDDDLEEVKPKSSQILMDDDDDEDEVIQKPKSNQILLEETIVPSPVQSSPNKRKIQENNEIPLEDSPPSKKQKIDQVINSPPLDEKTKEVSKEDALKKKKRKMLEKFTGKRKFYDD
jgi:hypothetical protein